MIKCTIFLKLCTSMLILTHFNTTTDKNKIEKACEEKICCMFFFLLKFQIQDISSEKLFNDTENVYDFHKL
jgi:hypothetical protein